MSDVHGEDVTATEGEPTPLAVQRLKRNVYAAAQQMAQEHPLDTLLRNMRHHGWSDDDPMVRWVLEAMAVPYPMTLTEAYACGLLPLQGKQEGS